MMKNYTVADALEVFYKTVSTLILVWIGCEVVAGVIRQHGVLAGIITGTIEILVILLVGFILCYLDDE